MYILGICEGHGASAALLKDGKIIRCVNEERLNRIKGFEGFPWLSVKYLIKSEGISTIDIDKIILPSLHPFSFILDEKNRNGGPTFSNIVFNTLLSDNLYWTTAKIGYKFPLFEKYLLTLRNLVNEKIVQGRMFRRRCVSLAKQIGIEVSKISSVSHQLSHALAGIHAYPDLMRDKLLVMTSDGMGNHNCSTVYVVDNNEITTISQTPNFNSLAFIYGMVTKYLGMKFMEHEYKVMGLSPYADEVGVDKAYEIMKDLIQVTDDLRFQATNSTRVVYYFLEDKLREFRFDWIAGAAQKLVEDLVVNWVKRAVAKTGIQNIVLGGGLFMNVKANMAVSELPEVNKVYACPASSDESCAIGAAIYGFLYGNDGKPIGNDVKPLNNLYLGPEYSNYTIEKTLSGHNSEFTFKQYDNIEKEVGALLAKNKIVARFDGPMEFGPRALGNRSILGNPSWEDTVQVINRLIKNRDFWMPFAASILKERMHDYIINPKEIPAPYMSMAFMTKERAWKELRASIHPYDKTIRPQIVDRTENEKYYKVLKEFESLTGVGGVLNTSFNLHGSPIVCSPEDAVDTFLTSGLDYMAIGNFLVTKK